MNIKTTPIFIISLIGMIIILLVIEAVLNTMPSITYRNEYDRSGFTYGYVDHRL